MPPSDKVYIDPSTFQDGQLTFILCNDARHFLSFLIKWYTGNYNHIMVTRRPGWVCTQNDLYEEVPLSNYLISSEGLKFFRVADLTPDEFKIINDAISADLAKPWWMRIYDYVGIFGQILHQPWISIPGHYFCSKRCAEYLRLLPRLVEIIPQEPSPSEIDAIVESNKGLFQICGYWWKD